MALPTIFANLNNATGAELDVNFAALGAISIIPCGVTGTNAISLAPLAGNPAVTEYDNYMTFSGVAAADNTAAVTAGVGSLASLPVFKDTPAGPTQLTGAEIQDGNLITLTYDAALGANGGFHLQTGINSSAGTFLPLTGGTLTGVMYGTSLSLTGDIAVNDGVFTGGVNGVSVTAIQANIGGTSATTVKGIFSTTVSSVVFPTILPNASADQSSPFANLALNDTVMLGLPSLATVGVSFNGFAAAAGTVTLRAFNVTGSTISGLTLSTVRFTTMRF